MPKHSTWTRALLCSLVLGLAIPASANAGRLVATGHDADHHCARQGGRGTDNQCHFIKAIVDYVRATSPNPTKPVLVLDRGPLDVVKSLDKAYGGGVMPRKVVDPRGAEFASMPITTDLYSAIVIASSQGVATDALPQDLNEADSAPDSDAIVARSGAIRAFFDAGGGVFANAGYLWGDEPGDPYYAFLPIPIKATTVHPGFHLTTVGHNLGLTDGTNGSFDDINCCETHNSLDEPSAGSPLQVAERDAQGGPVTLASIETTSAELAKDPKLATGETVRGIKGLPTTGRCLRRRFLRIRVPKKVRHLELTKVIVFTNWRRFRTIDDRRVRKAFRVTVRGRAGKFRLRLQLTFATGTKLNVRRTYDICAKKK